MAAGIGGSTSIFSLLDKEGNDLWESGHSESEPLISDSDFVKIVGLVEDIFVGEDFQVQHSEYFTSHCAQFSKGTDPPLGSAELENLTKERFNIFRTYSVETATFLERELRRSLGDTFQIDLFIQEVERRMKLAESSGLGEKSEKAIQEGCNPTSPRFQATKAESTNKAFNTDCAEIFGGEIFEILLTLKDYARFQELMIDYLEMIQGTTPDIEGLVSLRHLSDDEDDIN